MLPVDRVIGVIEGELPGPLLIVTGAVHGNEPAGVGALQRVLGIWQNAVQRGENHPFRGKMMGVVGNLQAFNRKQRFLERDLNRVWAPDVIHQLEAATPDALEAEFQEAKVLIELFREASRTFQQVVFLDLHTTSAEGGVFSIPVDEAASLSLAKQLGAPAILGLQQGIDGTMLRYAADGGFTPHTAELPVCVAFEAGQHESAQSVQRGATAIVRCLLSIGCIETESLLDNRELAPLPVWPHTPPVLQLRYSHHIQPEDGFRMRPGYANFQPVYDGEHLADDAHGPVFSPHKGLILMPLYQPKGSDGFFIVQ